MAVEDIRHVVDYLATLPCVDEDRMGILGICGGGSCVIDPTMTERRIKAVASMTGINCGRRCREAFAVSIPSPQG